MRMPFVIDVTDDLRHPGHRRRVALVAPVGEVALSASRVAADVDVEVDAVLEAQGASIIVTGTVRAPWTGECRRCLEPTSGEVTLELQEVFEAHATEGETFPVIDERIDLAPMLRESLALGLPLAPLCSEACPGPDPDGHPVATEDDSVGEGDEAMAAAARPSDPRWAALDELHFDN
jgi:uncharacterized protein